MPILSSVPHLAAALRAGRPHLPAPIRRSGWTRLLALGLAAGLALLLVLAAGHRHDGGSDTHVCGICAALMAELPCTEGLPAVVAAMKASWYPVLVAGAYFCLYRSPALMPPICGPPARASAT